MNSKKFFLVMIASFAASVMLCLGVLVGGDMLLRRQGAKIADLKLQADVLEEQQRVLTKTKKDVEKYQYFNDIARQVIPQDKDQAKAVREILSIAAESGISIKAISFPASDLGDKKPAASGTTPTSTAAISQAKPVEGVPGVLQLEVTITPQLTEHTSSSNRDTIGVSYGRFLDFLERIENNRRTAQIAEVSVSPQTSSIKAPLVDFVLKINIFLKP